MPFPPRRTFRPELQPNPPLSAEMDYHLAPVPLFAEASGTQYPLISLLASFSFYSSFKNFCRSVSSFCLSGFFPLFPLLSFSFFFLLCRHVFVPYFLSVEGVLPPFFTFFRSSPQCKIVGDLHVLVREYFLRLYPFFFILSIHCPITDLVTLLVHPQVPGTSLPLAGQPPPRNTTPFHWKQ